MPIFEYKCEGCGLSFEELKTIKEDSQSIPCRKCGAKSNKKMSSFAHSVPGGTTNETVDMHIGREADKKWQSYHDRQSKRHEGHSLQTFDLPKAPDNKYMPIMGLGTTQEKKDRNEFVGALQEHRKQRVEKGVPQFSEGAAV